MGGFGTGRELIATAGECRYGSRRERVGAFLSSFWSGEFDFVPCL